jgi:PEP-CTERM motif
MGKLAKVIHVAVLSVASLFGAAAQADTFQGSVWSVWAEAGPLPDVNPLTETYRVYLNVDTSGYTGGGSFLDQIGLKVSSSLISATLIGAPGGAAAWSLLAGGINAAGCSGSGSGFQCANSTLLLNDGKGVAVGGSYAWAFDLTMNNGSLFTDLIGTSVKGRFVDVGGNKVGDLVSETLPVPEPEIYAMMLAGLGMLGFMSRRQKRGQAAA